MPWVLVAKRDTATASEERPADILYARGLAEAEALRWSGFLQGMFDMAEEAKCGEAANRRSDELQLRITGYFWHARVYSDAAGGDEQVSYLVAGRWPSRNRSNHPGDVGDPEIQSLWEQLTHNLSLEVRKLDGI